MNWEIGGGGGWGLMAVKFLPHRCRVLHIMNKIL